MFTIIITLLLPLVSLGIWRQYVLKNNGSTGKTVTGSKGSYVLRYATCLMIMLFVPWVLLSLTGNDDNTILRTRRIPGICSQRADPGNLHHAGIYHL